MRKIALLLLFMSCLCYGQHISFMGIPLGRNTDVVERELKAKGFYFINETMVGDRFRGDFWEFSDCSVWVESDDDKVTSISVVANGSEQLLRSLIADLNRKYGNHQDANSFSSELEGYLWKVSGGYVNVYGQDIVGLLIHLTYYDNTSLVVQRAKSAVRNKKNDL